MGSKFNDVKLSSELSLCKLQENIGDMNDKGGSHTDIRTKEARTQIEGI
jgi:hypothetical protein